RPAAAPGVSRPACAPSSRPRGRRVSSPNRALRMMRPHAPNFPAPPSRRPELPIPPELEAIVMSLLAKDPDARPQSAAELASRLEAVPLPAPRTRQRAEQWWQSHLPQVIHQAATLRAEVALQG